MAANTPITNLNRAAQENIVEFYKSCASITSSAWNLRDKMKRIDRLYARETDATLEEARAKLANNRGDPTKFRNVTVPIVYTVVESAVTYQTSVFLTGVPLFGVSAEPVHMDAALQMETVLDNQAIRGGWARELQLLFRDGFKYNFGAAEVTWETKKIFSPETALEFSASQAKPVETYWEGNVVKRLDPYNIIFDSRYSPIDIPKHGEFVGYVELISHVQLRQYVQELAYRYNTKKAYESNTPSGVQMPAFPYSYYIPDINPDALLDIPQTGSMDWFAWAGLKDRKNQIAYKNTYQRTTFYARIVPADFGIPSPAAHEPQIWKFVIINNSVLIYAERQTNAHNNLPILFIQPQEDGLGYQTKSMASNVEPFQAVGSALVNSSIAARRRAISDRGLYDPSRVDAAHINNDSASAKIPVKPAAYGKPLSEAYYPIPFRDEQSPSAMSDLQAMFGMSEQIAGQNRAQQGQFVKGNKTLFEYQDVMANANARAQSVSMLLEFQFFTPLKEILKLNVLQYQKSDSLFNRELSEVVPIDPVLLRTANLVFEVSDGLIPAAKQMNTEAFQAAAQTIAAVPELAQAYNIGPLFSYLFKTQRADVAKFEKPIEQIQYEQAMTQWQQAVMMITETFSKRPDFDPEEFQAALPPQPTPEQFNIPDTPRSQAISSTPIIQQVAQNLAPNDNL